MRVIGGWMWGGTDEQQAIKAVLESLDKGEKTSQIVEETVKIQLVRLLWLHPDNDYL